MTSQLLICTRNQSIYLILYLITVFEMKSGLLFHRSTKLNFFLLLSSRSYCKLAENDALYSNLTFLPKKTDTPERRDASRLEMKPKLTECSKRTRILKIEPDLFLYSKYISKLIFLFSLGASSQCSKQEGVRYMASFWKTLGYFH